MTENMCSFIHVTKIVHITKNNITKNNRHPTSRGCKTRKLEPAQSTLAKLMKALFEMERIFEEKAGKSKTPLFVGPGGEGGGYSLIAI